MSRAEMTELYGAAITWTKGDAERAVLLVSAYLRGATDRAIIESIKAEQVRE